MGWRGALQPRSRCGSDRLARWPTRWPTAQVAGAFGHGDGGWLCSASTRGEGSGGRTGVAWGGTASALERAYAPDTGRPLPAPGAACPAPLSPADLHAHQRCAPQPATRALGGAPLAEHAGPPAAALANCTAQPQGQLDSQALEGSLPSAVLPGSQPRALQLAQEASPAAGLNRLAVGLAWAAGQLTWGSRCHRSLVPSPLASLGQLGAVCGPHFGSRPHRSAGPLASLGQQADK
jgi:hypothetical protein